MQEDKERLFSSSGRPAFITCTNHAALGSACIITARVFSQIANKILFQLGDLSFSAWRSGCVSLDGLCKEPVAPELTAATRRCDRSHAL